MTNETIKEYHNINRLIDEFLNDIDQWNDTELKEQQALILTSAIAKLEYLLVRVCSLKS
jgi:hypothetical protein